LCYCAIVLWMVLLCTSCHSRFLPANMGDKVSGANLRVSVAIILYDRSKNKLDARCKGIRI